MLRIHIQNIAFITFLDDVISVQEYIYGMKILYGHNQDCIVCVKAVYLSPPLSKLDLTLFSMYRDVGHTSLDTSRIGNSFGFVVILSSI
jgi:hypothetical protein